ncbi:MAG: phosphoglycerate dehydrogenase [Chloroflexi bacterium]|nr:phosphoglycerate dehydrogenase [Chloroflexota bacterium]
MHRILITDDLGPAGLAILDKASDVQYDVVKLPDRQKLIELIGEYDAIITRSGTPLDAASFQAARQLKIAGRAGVGMDNVDIDAATLRGILVMNTPEANMLAATELTMALMLALFRRVPWADQSIKRGEWTRSKFMGMQLADHTIGIIGLGRIGSRVATRCLAFGMRVLAYDPYIPEEIAERLRVHLVGDLDELLRESDLITLHTPLTDETRAMIGAEQIAKMKPGVRLINCARGGVIDEQALYDGLVAGKIGGAAIDVYSVEPPRTELLKKLLALDSVVATPHIGANTVEAQRNVAVQIVNQVLDALRGTNYANVVNLPFAEGIDYRSIQPYMTLAERIGTIHMQLMHGRIERVEVECRGEAVEKLIKPLTVALLKGLLQPILSDAVNYVNAPRLADERGILVSQTRHPAAEDYSNVILCRVSSPHETRLIGGALFLHHQPRIVLMDDYRLDAPLAGRALFTVNHDVPGVVGKVGTILANHAINIAEWRMARNAPGGTAVSYINIDSPVGDDVLSELRALPTIMDVRQVAL